MTKNFFHPNTHSPRSDNVERTNVLLISGFYGKILSHTNMFTSK